MLETSRRSAISTSELGLYSDRTDRYNRNRYGLIVRKFAIGVMVVVTVILVAIFMYDFASATSANSKVNQETKHIYILQNALKKSSNPSKKSTNSTILPEAIINQTDSFSLEGRSTDNYENLMQRNGTIDLTLPEPRIMRSGELESRAQNLQNFKQRKRVLKSVEDGTENEEPEAKQLLDNHAIVYRVRQRYKHPDPDEDDSNAEEARPAPFHWEFKTPHPSSFKRPRYPQLSQYRYPQSSRNIQDIIKYLTNDAEMPNRGIKFAGVYVNPKKYDLFPGIGEMMSSSDKSEEDEAPPYPVAYNSDPFYQYKPKHPADVNLLATSNVRFSPTGIHRYSSYYHPLYSRPLLNYKPVGTEGQYENVGAYTTNTLGKSRKPKPFSVMLDIYPITDIMEQNKKTWPQPQTSTDDYETRRPFQFTRGPKLYGPQPPIPLIAVPSPTTLQEEEERQQMIFHLNLYPRKKNKLNRNDIIHRSESMGPEERQNFAKKIMSPLESIAKHLTDHSVIGESKFEENENPETIAKRLTDHSVVAESKFEENENPETASLSLTRYHEMNLDDKDEEDKSHEIIKDSEAYPDPNNDDDRAKEKVDVPSNHKLNIDEDYASMEKFKIDLQTMAESKNNDCANCDITTAINDPKTNSNKSADLLQDADTLEGFQRFSDSPLHSD